MRLLRTLCLRLWRKDLSLSLALALFCLHFFSIFSLQKEKEKEKEKKIFCQFFKKIEGAAMMASSSQEDSSSRTRNYGDGPPWIFTGR